MPKPPLSIDASCVLGAVFQHGMVLSFQMIESRPTPRMQAALDELLKAEIIVKEFGCERGDGSRVIKYKARVPVDAYRRFAKKSDIVIAEPIPG